MNRNVVVRKIERAEPVIDGLGPAGTATVHEAIGRVGYAGSDLRPIQQDVRIAGSAVTVLSHPGDNIMIHAAVEVCRRATCWSWSNTAPSSHGMFGELLATSLQTRGARLVIDAGVRDTSELRAMGFPVWSRHVSCQGTVKSTAGSVNVPVVLGAGRQPGRRGVRRRRRRGGRAADAAWALAESQARTAKEEQTGATRAGELGVDLYGLRAKLQELGVEYVDRLSGDTP